MIEPLTGTLDGRSNLVCISGEGSLLILLPEPLVSLWTGKPVEWQSCSYKHD